MTFAPIMYNLFPRHSEHIDDWKKVIPHIKQMGFNAVFVNPFHETGFSGSLYAVKDYYKLNPFFLKKKQDPTDFSPLKKFIAECATHGIMPVMDLVINHTAIDSELTKSKPAWYRRDGAGKVQSPYCVDVDVPGKVVVWGDLGEIDNEHSSDRDNLWKYWDKLVAFYQELGIGGFRCDAAYKVPFELWKMLIASAKKRNSKTVFMAETLGCREDEMFALKGAGFDFFFNSSKYWQFDKSWCIDQHEKFRDLAPSIAFPESHDTVRLASEAPGTVEMQMSRYLFALLFSKGVMMVSGYEFGATIKTDVVKGSITDLERPQWDLSVWIASVNALKFSLPLLSEEGHWRQITTYDHDILVLERTSDNRQEKMLVLINKDWHNGRTVEQWELPGEAGEYPTIIAPFDNGNRKPKPGSIYLRPTEIVLFVK